MSELLFNPFDPAFRADPYPFYDVLRDTAPAYWTPFDTLVLSRYDDVARTLRSSSWFRKTLRSSTSAFSGLRTSAS